MYMDENMDILLYARVVAVPQKISILFSDFSN